MYLSVLQRGGNEKVPHRDRAAILGARPIPQGALAVFLPCPRRCRGLKYQRIFKAFTLCVRGKKPRGFIRLN
jgi:hypothetical protein